MFSAENLQQKEGIKMRKIIALLMALTMTFALCACGGGGGTSSDAFAKIDKKSTERQTVSTEHASKEKLKEVLAGLYGDNGLKRITYDEAKKLIGVDCTVYVYDPDGSRGLYIWEVKGENEGSLTLAFGEDGKLLGAGAVNLSDE